MTLADGAATAQYTLTNGYTYGSMYAAANPFAFLYSMTDTGVGPTFNAVPVNYYMNHYAAAVVTVYQKVTYKTKLNITDENGKAVEVHAEKNEELLKKMISMDEGAAGLGECALVPYDSPIRKSGILFYNTLFDENAACHLALGMGFADTIENFHEKTLAECRALGVNDSMIHEDFMIGSRDMNIDAVCADGKTVPIFRSGNWAF